MPANPIDPEVMRAVERFSANVTIPVLYDDPNKDLDQIGTSTLFNLDDRFFLVTAGHLFEDRDRERFAIPTPTTTRVHTLGRYNLLQPDTDLIDIAVLELLEEQTIERARAGWRALILENLGDASAKGIFALSGYPSERARRIGGLIGGSLVTAYSERIPIPADADPPASPQLYLFFHYDLKAIDINGNVIAAPHLGGASGCSIWEYHEPAGMKFWTPEQCLKMVGVQSSFRKGRYFRAKCTAALLKILRKADNRLAGVVDSYLRDATKKTARPAAPAVVMARPLRPVEVSAEPDAAIARWGACLTFARKIQQLGDSRLADLRLAVSQRSDWNHMVTFVAPSGFAC